AGGRANQTQIDLWVAGGQDGTPGVDDAEQEEVTLIPDRESYAPGDTARVQIDVPFAPADLLVTLRRQGIVSYQQIHSPDGSHTLELPITEKSMPQLRVNVDAVGEALRGESDEQVLQPVQARGQLELPVST